MDNGNLRIPRSLAIIMDGNGRWARQRGLPRIEGHRNGVTSVRETVTAARKLGVEALTLYAFSTENWKRPKMEVSALMQLLKYFLKAELPTMLENDIRFGTIGDRSQLSKGVRKALEDVSEKTAHCKSMRLNLALSYGGRDEIIRAARKWGADVAEGRRRPEELDQEVFASYLDTAGLPELDLLIRTSGEMRVSNFLLWQIAYAEIYVTPVLWPDFREPQLIEAFEDFTRRERRYGGVEPDGVL